MPSGFDNARNALGYEQLTGLTSAKALTGQAGARVALIEVEGADVRWRDDGTSPTASVGMVLLEDTGMVYVSDPSKLKFIEVSATAKVNVSYYA